MKMFVSIRNFMAGLAGARISVSAGTADFLAGAVGETWRSKKPGHPWPSSARAREADMSQYFLYRQADGNLGLTYQGIASPDLIRLGSLRPDTPMKMLMEWLVTVGNAQAFDLLLIHGRAFAVMPPLHGRC
jgi:hypothetical protein